MSFSCEEQASREKATVLFSFPFTFVHLALKTLQVIFFLSFFTLGNEMIHGGIPSGHSCSDHILMGPDE